MRDWRVASVQSFEEKCGGFSHPGADFVSQVGVEDDDSRSVECLVVPPRRTRTPTPCIVLLLLRLDPRELRT